MAGGAVIAGQPAGIGHGCGIGDYRSAPGVGRLDFAQVEAHQPPYVAAQDVDGGRAALHIAGGYFRAGEGIAHQTADIYVAVHVGGY